MAVPGVRRLSRGQVWRLRTVDRLSRRVRSERDRGARLYDLAADPLRQQHGETRSPDWLAFAADVDADQGPMPRPVRTAMARHRRGRARHRCAAVLRLPRLRAVRLDPRRRLFRRRRRGGGGAGLFRRTARSGHAARHRNLVVAAAIVHSHHPFGDAGAELLDAARHFAAVLVDQPRASGAGGIPAHAQLRICQRRARAGPQRLSHHRQTRAAQRDGGDADVCAVHRQRLDRRFDLARLSRPRPAAGFAVAGRIAVRGQGQSVGAVACAVGVLHRGADAVVAGVHRRGGA